MYNGILCKDITNHFPVFTVLCERQVVTKNDFITKRDYSQSHIEIFIGTLSNYNWNCITDITDCAVAFTFFHSEFKRLYDKCFPIRNFRCGYKNRKCWLSVGVKNSIKVKNKLYVISKRFTSDDNIQCYKAYKNKLQTLMRSAEKQHFHELFEANRRNLKKSWAIIKNIINKKQFGNKSCEFVINGEITADQKLIADTFNNTNIGKNL